MESLKQGEVIRNERQDCMVFGPASDMLRCRRPGAGVYRDASQDVEVRGTSRFTDTRGNGPEARPGYSTEEVEVLACAAPRAATPKVYYDPISPHLRKAVGEHGEAADKYLNHLLTGALRFRAVHDMEPADALTSALRMAAKAEKEHRAQKGEGIEGYGEFLDRIGAIVENICTVPPYKGAVGLFRS